MLKINKFPLAEEDLINIWIYGYHKWGIAQADNYADSLEAKFKSLAQLPKKYSVRNKLNPPVRICPHVSHIIIYTIEDDAILIIRVLHKSMDVKRHL